MANPQLPAWYYQTLSQGLAKLYVLRLEGAPAADTLQGVAQVWAEALWQKQSWQPTDQKRLTRAFVQLAANCQRWPAPAQLLQNLPPKPIINALPNQPSLSPEQAALNRQQLRQLLNQLNRSTSGRNKPS